MAKSRRVVSKGSVTGNNRIRSGRDQKVGLTIRQVEVLTLLAHGHKAPAIATILGIRRCTAEEHIEGAKRMLAARSEGEAVRLGICHGFIEAGL